MTFEIENYEAPPGAEKQTLVKNEDLEHYVKTMVQTGGFKDQFKMLRGGQQKPWEIGRKPENKAKNRYQDLLPYDDSRVVLQKLKGDPHSDYINASHVEGYEKRISYICTQGPLDKTVGDFWRMIWQEDVNVISMTANIIESGKKKCEKYWPDKTLKIADLIVTFQNEQVFLDYTIRNFKLQKIGTSGHRCVRQYQYTAWPDHGVPPSPLPVIAMLDDTERYQRAQNKRTPWVLHCSAGVGRSGSVLLLDAALQMSRAEGRVDVLGLLYAMRQQRVGLIEKLEQYVFVYEALVEFHFGDVSCKAATEMVLYFNKLRQLDQGTRRTGLEQQFQRLSAMEPAHFAQKCLAASTENNQSKNRDPAILPPDDGRPILKTGPPSNYINAVYAYDYGQQNRFVVTQFPLPGTMADFWQLVCDTGATCVVVVNELSSKDEAWRRLYEQTDRVKRLQQAINLSDALTQRERQVSVKQKRAAAFDRLDDEYLKGMLRDVAQHECEQADEGQRHRDNRRRNADNWNRQRRQAEEKRRRDTIEHHKMGFQIRDEASRHEEDVAREKREQWQQKLECRKVLDQEVATKRALRNMEKSMEEADQKRAEVFQEAKRKMALQRKANFQEAEREREEKATKMRNHLIEQQATSKSKEDENLRKAILEKERQRQHEKATRREEAQEQIQRFYEGKLKAKEEARREDYRRRFREGQGLRDTADQMYKAEEAKEARWEAGEREGQHVQLHQIAHRRQKRQLDKMEEMKDYMRHMRELDGEEELFQKYAQMRLEECEAKSMLTYPVKVAAQPGIECGKGPLLVDRAHIRPKYYAAVRDPDELHVVHRSGTVLDTKARLGFIS